MVSAHNYACLHRQKIPPKKNDLIETLNSHSTQLLNSEPVKLGFRTHIAEHQHCHRWCRTCWCCQLLLGSTIPEPSERRQQSSPVARAVPVLFTLAPVLHGQLEHLVKRTLLGLTSLPSANQGDWGQWRWAITAWKMVDNTTGQRKMVAVCEELWVDADTPPVA